MNKMKNKNLFRTALSLLAATWMFDLVFWEHSPGIGMVLFSLVVVALLILVEGKRNFSSIAWTALGMTLLTGGMVVLHHSILAIIMHMLSLVTFATLAHETALRSISSAIPQVLVNIATTPVVAVQSIGALTHDGATTRKGWSWLRLGAIPVVVLFVFFQLYRVANPKFEDLSAGFVDSFVELFGDLFENVFTSHFLFILFGLLVCGLLLARNAPNFMHEIERRWGDVMQRIRKKRPHWKSPLSMGALDRERRMGLVLLVLVNALLLIVNVIDISWVWVGFEVPEGFNLKQFVHEGTWALIFSILLSMLILFRLFRGNLNFHPNNKWLVRLGMLWVAQNFILGISVFLRNYHYIDFHGLAYKRIGVIVFLALVLVGLVTLFVKITQKKTFFYMLRINSLAAFLLLGSLTVINWDLFIVKYNLAHSNPSEIDVDHYLDLSAKVLPELYANLDVVERQMVKHSQNKVRWLDYEAPETFREALDLERDRFIDHFEQKGWQSWSLAEQRTYNSLNPNGPASTIKQ